MFDASVIANIFTFFDRFLHHRLRLLHRTQFCRRVSDRSVALAASCSSDKFWERGSPDLPACGPRRGYASGPVRPIFINKAFKTLARGQASRGGRRKTSSGAASPGYLARSGDIKAGQTSRGSRDVSHDDRRQAGRQRAQHPCFLFGAKEAGAGKE